MIKEHPESFLLIVCVLAVGFLGLHTEKRHKTVSVEAVVSTEVAVMVACGALCFIGGFSLYLVSVLKKEREKENTVEALSDKLRGSDDPIVRQVSAWRLGFKEPTEETLTLLVNSYSNDPNIFVRSEALKALDRIAPDKLDKVLLQKSFEDAHLPLQKQ